MPNSPQASAELKLQSIGRWFSRRNVATIALVVGALAVLRNGVRYSGWEGSIDQALAAFPVAVNYNSSALLAIAIAALVPVEARSGALLNLIPQLVTILIILVLARRQLVRSLECVDQRACGITAIVAVSLTPTVTLLMGNIGFGRDWIPVLGLGLAALARTGRVALGGAVIAVLGNPEQAVVALGLFLLAVQSQPLRRWRRRGAVMFVAAVAVSLPLALWQSLSGSESRLTFLVSNFQSTLSAFVTDAYIATYAALSASWAIVLFWSLSQPAGRRLWPVWASVGLGIGVMALTTDGTRVFAIIITPTILVLILNLVEKFAKAEAQTGIPYVQRLLAGLLLVGILMPAVSWSRHAGIPATSASASLSDTMSRLLVEMR